MNAKYRSVSLAAWAAVVLLSGSGILKATPSAWEKPRALSDFQELLTHSPFSLPTAEESSPLGDRYALTGIVTRGGEERIFIFDKSDQSRDVLTHTPNDKNMSLVALVREGDDPPNKATIRVGGDTGTIAYLEASPQQQPTQIPGFGPGMPGQIRPPGLQLPPLPQRPGMTGPNIPLGMVPPMRHIIRRPMINPPPSQPAP